MDKNCNYCIKKTEVYPLASWNNKEVIRYYCINCLPMVKKVEEKERQQFIMYYSDPTRYSWLPEKSKELYKEILDQ
ncbi:hypothetical protein [Thalassobacillus devorans]|uniref:hypothetical protein n=1 Tax=Thalassobacillus devorans TaxID=279813 RepID=UPI000A1C9F20|nr:hypothetical protein [Thalassobacillus devorans]